MSAELIHGSYALNGISLHVVEAGAGPAIVLCHGFPELWYSWRHQIGALADAGFRVIIPDMRGSGETSAPLEIAKYSHQEVCRDLVELLDRLELDRAIFLGHDWGGVVCWNLALHYPERVRAVGGICGSPIWPGFDFLTTFKDRAGIWDYHFYFLEPGVAEAELEADLERFFDLIVRSSRPEDEFDILYDFHSVRKRGGLLVGYPERVRRTVIRTQEEQQFFVDQFRKTGLRGALNWYRVHDLNFEWSKRAIGKIIDVPALLVTAGKDPVITQGLSAGLESWVPDLTRHYIEDASHWLPEEHPSLVNQILLDWTREKGLS